MRSADQVRPDGLSVAGTAISLVDAAAVVAGYCLGERAVPWTKPAKGVGQPLTTRSCRRFAYRTYDCLAAGPTHRLEPVDVLVADGRNAQMRAKDISAVLAVADEVSAECCQPGGRYP